MEVGWRGILVVVLLLGVLGGAVAYSLWPESGGDDGTKPGETIAAAPEEKKKTLAEQLEELESRQESLADAGVTTLTGIVENGDGKPVPNAEVWVVASGGEELIDALTCETCGVELYDCGSIEAARQVLMLARAGKLVPKRLATTKSDAKGRFTFAEVPAAELEVHARAPGYGEGSQYTDTSMPDPEEKADDDEGLFVQLAPVTRRPAQVTDQDDKPVRGARVAMFDRQTGGVTDAVSDDRGNFEVPATSNGVLWVFVEAQGFLPTVSHDYYLGGGEGEGEEDDRSVIRLDRPHRLRVETRLAGKLVDAKVEVIGLDHPKAMIASGGIALFEELPSGSFEVMAKYQQYVAPKQYADLSSGAETVVRVDLKPAARLSVGVFDEKGDPVQLARVSVEGYGNSEMNVSDDSGALVLFENLAEGAYQVHVEAAGLRDAQRRVDLHAGDNHLEVTLQAASMLSGKVVDAEGKPVQAATVELVSQIHEALATTTSEEGTFEMQVDEPGAYRLRAREAEHGVVIAQVTAPAEQLVLKLEPLARLEVKVVSAGAPVKGAYVSVFGVGAASEDNGTSTSDERGMARLAGLHGGDYMVNVEKSGFQRVEQQPVKLAANGRVEVTVTLEQGVEIAGKVVDEAGNPVPNADVHTVYDEPKAGEKAEPATDVASTYTDDRGEFSLEGLKPGRTYTLAASADDRSTKAPVKVKAPAASVTLKLELLPAVKGRVLDEAGQPVASFRVDGKEFEVTDGRFSVGREPDSEGKLYLNVDADGYETLTFDGPFAADLGDLKLKKAPLVRGVVVDATGQPVSGADVTCDQCIDSAVSGGDGSFTLAVSGESPEPTVSASKLNYRGKGKVTGAAQVTVKLEAPVRVEGIVKDPSGRAVSARITVREINGAEEERFDSGPDGKFELDLPEGMWMFITRLSASGQTVKVVGPRVFVTLGAPPGTCAVTITVAEPVGDAWLVPGEPASVPLESLDDDALYAGAVALDLPLPNRPTRSAGLQCGVYTLITTDSSGVRRERVDVRASEALYVMTPAPPPAPETAAASGGSVPGQP